MRRREDIYLVDYKKYPFYICDYKDSCIGGCNASKQCDANRDQSSKVCGVCESNYFISSGACYSCDRYAGETSLILWYFVISASVVFSGLSFVMYFALKSNLNRTDETSSVFSNVALLNLFKNGAMTNKLFFSFVQVLTVAFRYVVPF